MSRPKNYHQVPKPSSAVAARNRLEAGALDEKTLARLWRPRAGSLLEVVLATISRLSLRLIDRVTGEAYSADELEAKILEAVGALTRTALEGVPINEVVWIPHYLETNFTSEANNDVRFQQKASDVLPTIQIVNGGSFTSFLVAVSVVGTAITLTLKTNFSIASALGSEIIAAVNAHPQASLLVVASNKTGNDGSGAVGTVFLLGATDLSGGADPVVGSPTPAAVGQLCIVDASDVYVAAQVSPPIWLGPLNQ